jgi:hypothetical protein
MDWQQLVALTIVGITAVVLLWSRFHPRKFSFERRASCGGCAVGQPAPLYSVVFRARKGERPQLRVKMK